MHARPPYSHSPCHALTKLSPIRYLRWPIQKPSNATLPNPQTLKCKNYICDYLLYDVTI